MLIAEFLEWERHAGHTSATIHVRQDVLMRADRELPYGLERCTVDELSEWLYRESWSLNTWATYYHAFAAFFAWATNPRDPWLDHNPVELLPRPRPPRGTARHVPDAIVARILIEAKEPYRTFAVLAAYQGLRCCEISGLDREHVTEVNLYVARGKGGPPRWHDTDPSVWAAVRGLPPGPIARLVNGSRASAKAISSRTGVHFRSLGLAGVTLHRLRHWLGVTVQREYKDPRVTQRVLGHASLSSTQIYTDATDEQQRAARATLPRFPGA